MPILDAFKESFDRDGFASTAEPLFHAAEIERITHHFDEVIAGRYDLGQAPHGINSFGGVLTKVSNAWWADSVIREIVQDSRIATVAAILLDAPELYLWADSLYWKAPLIAAEGAVVGWHQDKQYWGISDTDQMITATINLYEADTLSGGLRFAAGSHKWGLVGGADALTAGDNAEQHRRPPVPQGQRWQEVCPQLRPGHVTWHHCLTFHGSGPNLSAETRRSITIHMVSGVGRMAHPNLDMYFAGVAVGEPFRGPHFPRIH